MDTPDQAALEREFDVLMARIGAVVPPDRKAGVVAGFADLRKLTALMHEKHPATLEPSNIFTLTPYARKA
jgi:hypothetical protein